MLPQSGINSNWGPCGCDPYVLGADTHVFDLHGNWRTGVAVKGGLEVTEVQ